MDGEQFDATTKTLAAVPTRRRLLVGLLGGALGLRGLLDPEDAAASHARKRCSKIEDRQRRRRCLRRAVCRGHPDGTDCGGGKQCSGGVCATPPNCSNTGCNGGSDCCSNQCNTSTKFCSLSSPGQRCGSAFDCFSAKCVGFVCK